MSGINEEIEFIPIRIAVLTVSDTRDLQGDKSGQTLADRITAAGHILADRKILPDERSEIAQQLTAWCDNPEIDAVSYTHLTLPTTPYV